MPGALVVEARYARGTVNIAIKWSHQVRVFVISAEPQASYRVNQVPIPIAFAR